MNTKVSIFANVFQYILVVVQSKELFEWISLILAILSTILIIIMNVRKWWKEAKKDGKIDEDEVDELIDIVSDGVEDIKDKVDTTKKED